MSAFALMLLAGCPSGTPDGDGPSTPGPAPAPAFVAPPPALLPAGEAADTEVRLLPRAAEPELVLADLVTEPVPDGPPTEAEPNDTPEQANPLDASHTGRGKLTGKDTDHWELVVDGPPQLWSAEVTGSGVQTARIVQAGGRMQELLDASGDRHGAHGIYLSPGRYVVEIHGTDADYRVRMTPRGAPDRRTEREPNDAEGGAQALQLGETRGGWLVPVRDTDRWRFHLDQASHVRLTWSFPADTGVILEDQTSGRMILANVTTSGEGHWDGWLLPGGYGLALTGKGETTAPYRVRLDLLDPFVLPDDLEPNDAEATARPFPASLAVTGTLGTVDKTDVYTLPVPDRDARFAVTWTGAEPGGRADLLVQVGSKTVSTHEAPNRWTGTLPAGTASTLVVRRPGDYALELSIEGVAPVPRSDAPAVGLSAPPQVVQVAAYRELGQRVEVPITLTGTGRVELETWVGAQGWTATPASRSVDVKGSATVPVIVEVPTDADAEGPVTIGVAARSAPGGTPHTTAFVVQPVCGAPLVGARMHWALPPELVGGLNVAWSALGARAEHTDKRAANLIDGVTPNDSGFPAKTTTPVVVVLAGDRPEIAGVVLDLHGRPGNDAAVPFTVELSDGGTSYAPAVTGVLERRPGEQAFVLQAPRRATHARLTVPPGTTVGELKVIARPGSRPLGEGLLLSTDAHGGRFVRTRPYISQGPAILEDSAVNATYKIRPGEPLELVLAFHHGRIARIGALEWDQPKGHYPVRTKVTVAVSDSSPVGPWTPVDTWVLPEQGESGRLVLEPPVWGRYLKLANFEDEGRQGLLPASIRVFEATEPGRTSVLGEYGGSTRNGPYELQTGLSARADVRGERGENETIATATPLPLDTPVADQVSVGEDVDLYRVDVPKGHNRLVIQGTGEPTLNAVITLMTADGAVIPADVDRQADGTRIEATVPEGPVYVEVREPPRSVALLWDQSGSVSGFLPQIYSAVTEFVEGVESGKEVANLYPFQNADPGTFLSPTWLDQPGDLQRVLNDYDRRDKSSSAELALLSAVREMSEREGTKGILILTDAETHSNDRTPELWDRFGDVRPRVFTMELHIGNVPWHQDLMQGWADVDAGHYDWFSSANDLDVAFDRASCHLRRPQQVQLVASTSYEAPPEPGSIEVVSAGLDGYAVEIILDASGSMLQRIGGRSRIEIARDAIAGLVKDTIPPGTPVALRVFGHRQPKSCQTDLEIPLAPLDPAAVSAKVVGIEAKNLAKTPIGASLLAVEQDLAGHGGPKLVVLLTDGEETCGGNPPGAIQTLQDKGLDVRMNIVGLAIDDKKLQSDFQAWAKAGGGVYLDASTEAELGSAMLAALSPKVQVLDAAGDVLVEGTVGGAPLPVPVGTYTVKVLVSPVRTFDVTVASGQDVKLTLSE